MEELVGLNAAERLFLMIPIYRVVLGVFVLLILSAIGGIWLRRRFSGKDGTGGTGFEGEGYVVTAASGLLALLLGFTFAMAVDRFDERRMLVIDEANGIYSTYLLAQTFPQPDSGRISSTLLAYLDHRLAVSRKSPIDQKPGALQLDRHLKAQLWRESLEATRNLRDDVASTYLQTAAQTLEVGATREAIRLARIPPFIHVVLWVFSAITVTAFGFSYYGRARWLGLCVIIFLQTLALALILDLDRPTSGIIRESQWALEDVKHRLRDTPPSEFLPNNQTSAPEAPGGL
ncbi:hypothetical protein KK137_04120 [Croceibacterium sp. LX-88]|uniref:DUF4239 domain-containing protein n=1 Tax=Croceibacterium selenioxidans TaxID=2838833 RepID=A0ABS5W1E3_9SPHN|nr:hypothetical protein [Croceibacterium selenioxidans]MBT2133514.1 hypothetical protein [Croceibacterium selenioxidans]